MLEAGRTGYLRLSLSWAAALVGLLGTACTPAALPTEGRDSGPRTPGPGQSRTLVFIARSEPSNLGSAGGVGIDTTKRFFNATLTSRGIDGKPMGELAESLPQLHTNSWVVFPDGRMETTYRLKPNLTWHDGTAFSAEDFGFASRVYLTPELGSASAPPQALMEELLVPDPRTLIIRWRRPYPQAGELFEDFRPLPRHVMEPVFLQVQPEVFDAYPFWSREYVGLGPYRVDAWEPGAAIEGAAFDSYVFGRPKIDRLRVIFQQDPNVVLANLLAEAAHLVGDITIRFQTAVILRREWEPRNGGTVYLTPAQVRFAFFQLRPDYANPRGLLDLRVRKAIAHAIDNQALVDVLHEGHGIVADVFAPRRAEFFAEVDRATLKYPYDPRRTHQLMGEAGYTRGADGFYASPTDGRFAPEWRATAGGDSDTQVGVLVDALRQVGMDARPFLLRRPFEAETRHTFPAVFNWSTTAEPDTWFLTYTSAKIPHAGNRWSGNNGGGWSHAGYDHLGEAFATTLTRPERIQLMARMSRVLSEELPVIPLYYNLDVVAHVAALHAPNMVLADGSIGWNVHQWELRS